MLSPRVAHLQTLMQRVMTINTIHLRPKSVKILSPALKIKLFFNDLEILLGSVDTTN